MNHRAPSERPQRSGQEAGLPNKETAGADGEDVIFDMELADGDDLAALARAEGADSRVAEKAGRKP